MNPYGFSWWRACNANGVRLGRNFLVTPGSTIGDRAKFSYVQSHHNVEFTQALRDVPHHLCGLPLVTEKADMAAAALLSLQYVERPERAAQRVTASSESTPLFRTEASI